MGGIVEAVCDLGASIVARLCGGLETDISRGRPRPLLQVVACLLPVWNWRAYADELGVRYAYDSRVAHHADVQSVHTAVGRWWILRGMARFDDQDLTDAEFRECDLTRARLIGVVMQDAVIDGLVSNLVVNGVEVMSYVEAELDRRHPVRLLIRSADPADLLRGFVQLRTDWAATLERLQKLPKGSEHQRVGGEWSTVETLRHLVFVHDSWFRRCCLGSAEPFTAIGLACEFVPDQQEQGLDPAAAPTLDEVLAVRGRQGAELERWLQAVTAGQLSAPAPVPAGDGWPPYARGKSVLECVHVVLEEEWAHHSFCARDLHLLAG